MDDDSSQAPRAPDARHMVDAIPGPAWSSGPDGSVEKELLGIAGKRTLEMIADGASLSEILNELRAAWSEPLISNSGEVLGTFCIGYSQPRTPTSLDLQLIEAAGHIARIAIERHQSQEALTTALEAIKDSETNLRRVIDTIPTLAWCNSPDGPNEFLNKRWHEYTGRSHEESTGWGWQAAFHPEDVPPLMKKWRESYWHPASRVRSRPGCGVTMASIDGF